jgi:hypothetical protein
MLAYRWPFSSAHLEDLFTHLAILERIGLLKRVKASEEYQ